MAQALGAFQQGLHQGRAVSVYQEVAIDLAGLFGLALALEKIAAQPRQAQGGRRARTQRPVVAGPRRVDPTRHVIHHRVVQVIEHAKAGGFLQGGDAFHGPIRIVLGNVDPAPQQGRQKGAKALFGKACQYLIGPFPIVLLGRVHR